MYLLCIYLFFVMTSVLDCKKKVNKNKNELIMNYCYSYNLNNNFHYFKIAIHKRQNNYLFV